MSQRRFHYDLAFETYLRHHAVPYVAVDEAKRALVSSGAAAPFTGTPLKNFDFVVYSRAGSNLLIDVKGRKHCGRGDRGLQNWVTDDDLASLARWQTLFGRGFKSVFAFLYWCTNTPQVSLFDDLFLAGTRWYALYAIAADQYRPHARRRSRSWRTLNLPAADFRRLARPLRELL